MARLHKETPAVGAGAQMMSSTWGEAGPAAASKSIRRGFDSPLAPPFSDRSDMDGGKIAEAAPADKPKRRPARRAELSETKFAYEFFDVWTHGGFGPFNWRCETADWRSGRFWFDLPAPGHGTGWVGGNEAIAHARAYMAGLIRKPLRG